MDAAVKYIGIDPGLSKCGYALAAEDGRRLSLDIVPTEALGRRLLADVGNGRIGVVCVGDATKSELIVRIVREHCPQVQIALVDERNTSLEARGLYYQDHPPRGMWRLVPRGLLVPKEPLDGYAALLIIQRYRLSQSKT